MWVRYSTGTRSPRATSGGVVTATRGGLDIESEWAQQVMDDVDLVAFEPDPKSRMGASRFIGFSTDAGRVLVVIAFRDADGDLHGINAWPATGADLRFYREGTTDGEDD